jgi:transcriptional regulator of acetoin/glycerol metabolism
MQSSQREHIATVMQVAERGLVAAVKHDEIIRSSWLRCVHEHRLDPTRMQEAVILPSARIREHQDQMEDFLHIARFGLESLYQQVAGMGYVVLLTDARGVTVDFLGDLQLDHSLRRAGLHLGADWSEHHAGTCGVGTCITTAEALTVHQGDHFDATHIPLTCSCVPVFGADGRLNAVLDVSALTSPRDKNSQHMALQLVKMIAHQIENAWFLHRFRREWVLRLSAAPQFLDVNPEYLLAIDGAGRVVGHNRRAQLLFAGAGAAPLLGRSFDGLLNLDFGQIGRFMRALPASQRAVTLAADGRLLFMLASPPPAPRVDKTAEPAVPALPEPLAALSGGDPLLDRQIERAARLVNAPINILLCGETGTGKEVFAKALHQSSERRSGPFIAVNCAAIPETLIESELFGYLPGSFSGASAKGKRGLIAQADGGTLFLDEIGDMPLALQARLLRVLAEREVLPIGGSAPIAVNARVLAATHRGLDELARSGRFRDDLYYRLNGAQINLPPLRERHDFEWMLDKMLREQAARQGLAAAPALSPQALALLHAHRWPGNLRELRNVIQYGVAVCSDGCIEADDLPDDFLCPRNAALPSPQSAIDAHADAEALLQALRAHRWNVTAAAQALGIARMTLYRRMKRYRIIAPNARDSGHML